MSGRKLISLIGAAALCWAAASTANAQAAKNKPIDFTVRSETPAPSQDGAGKSLKWDARKGRWGLTFNLDQPATRTADWNDVEAGAYFRVTPSLRVGGAVSLGPQVKAPTTKKIEPTDNQPRVRLETAFKF